MDPILIAGAGPVGLAAAVFLKSQGFAVRIFDPLTKPTENSRALAINPRTLELLEPVGVCEKILKLGVKIHFAQIWLDQKFYAKIDLSVLPDKRPYMVALSQAVTERLLTEKLASLGVQVERDWGLKSIEEKASQLLIKVENKSSLEEKTLSGSYLIAADGAHSQARHLLGILFDGSSLEKEWYLADIHLETHLAPDQAHVDFLKDGGFHFLIRSVKDREAESEEKVPLWRIFSTSPDFLSSSKFGKIHGPPVWQSHFKISHRINRDFSKGHVVFMGDAAHIHSPLGARGMNLGIEDAWTFAHLLKEGRASEYAKNRHRVDSIVVKKIEVLSNVILARTLATQLLRRLILLALRLRPFQRVFGKTMAGLDHPLVYR